MIFLHPPKNTAFLYTSKKYLETIEPPKNIKFENFNIKKNSSSLCTGNFSKYTPPFPYYACLLTELLKIREFYVSATNVYLV